MIDEPMGRIEERLVAAWIALLGLGILGILLGTVVLAIWGKDAAGPFVLAGAAIAGIPTLLMLVWLMGEVIIAAFREALGR